MSLANSKRGACTECGLWLPLMYCTLCHECHCERHIGKHIENHYSDANFIDIALRMQSKEAPHG